MALNFAMGTLGMSYREFWHECTPRRLLAQIHQHYSAAEDRPMTPEEIVAQVKKGA